MAILQHGCSGEAGTATLLKKDGSNSIKFALDSDGDGYQAIFSPYGSWRNPECPDGKGYDSAFIDDISVFNFATNEVPSQINEYMSSTRTTPEDYDCLVLHQANMMIMKQIA